MASLDSLLVRKNLATGVARQTGTDTPVAIRLRYIGTGTVTSVDATAATNIVLVTSDGGTDTYAFATYTTVGAVVDAINAAGIFEAKALDVLRSLASASNIKTATVTSITDADGLVVWDFVADTSATFQISVCLTPSYRFGSFTAPKGHRVNLEQIEYSVNGTTGGAADSVQVWQRKGATETQLMGVLSVDTTATTIQFASGNSFLSGDTDADIIVIVKDASGIADATGNYVRVFGKVE